MTEKLPDHWFIEFWFISFASDVLFYWLHRVMHMKPFYKKMHKVHHEWIYSISLAHHYMTWDEALIFMLPPVVPPLLLGSHIMVMWVFMFWVQLNAILGHSAFCVPWLNKFKWLPFLQPSYHDLHHLRFNVNYGAMYPLTDKIFGTYRYEPIIYIDGIDPVIVDALKNNEETTTQALPNVKNDDDPWEHPEIKTGGYSIAKKSKQE